MTEDQIATVLDAIRKQGRAAVAAQAAAESCLEAVRKLEAPPPAPTSEGVVELLHRLLPAIDSLRRVAAEAASLDHARPSPLVRLVAPQRTHRIDNLIQGIRLLEAQFDNALASAGVTLDRAIGIPVDADRHHVVSVRSQKDRAGQVLEVTRDGYWIGERIVREAEVVAAVES